MNQKRITNQILKQELSLNSTLNYLFNISNMKKLFSYLLISSMVVLSSCTNYDDQFDDLNSQINSLKGQIEGFSSLSSGLTALQGTVSSLQSAVANIPVTPATDISGLEATQAALQAGLTELADAVAALKTQLDGAATADDVAGLAADLADAQTALDDLLKQNNIYSEDLDITTKAELDLAVALGDKITIVNGAVDIDQTDDMDAAVLQGVMNKITSVTGAVAFDATATGITVTPSFDNLASAASLTIDQKADVTLPELTTLTGALTINDDNKITSISAPKLVSVGSFGVTSFNKVKNFDMSSLLRLPAALSLSVDSGTVDFSSLISTTDATPVAESGFKIEIDGATIVKAPLITGGELDMDSVEEPNFPVWKGHADSQFDKAKKVVLPSITGAVAINLNTMAPKATYFHYIGNDGDDASTTTDDETYKYPSFTTTGHTNIETLIIGGSSTSVTVSGATDLTSFTITGGTHALTLTNNDAMTSYDLGHTSTVTNNENGAISHGSLSITGNAEITSITAASLDDIAELTITDNASLETLSFPSLNSLGTDDEGNALIAGESSVNIYDNDLTASLIQLPSAASVLPAVAGKITSDSGLNALKTYIGLALAKRGDASAKVAYDNVTNVLDSDGDDLATGQPIRLRTATGWSTNNTQNWDGEDSTVYLVNLEAGEVTTEGVDAVKQKQTYKIAGTYNDGAISLFAGASDKVAEVTLNTNAITGYVASDVSTWASALGTALNDKLTENGADYTVTVANDYGVTTTYDINVIDGDGTVSDATGASNTTGNITFTFGTQVSTSVAGATTASLTEAIARAINAGTSSDTWQAATTSVANEVRISPLGLGGVVDQGFAGTFPDFTFVGYSSGASTTGFVNASATIAQRLKVKSTGWRLTMQNDDTSFNAPSLNTAETASFISGGGLTYTESAFTASQTQLHVDFGDVVEGVDEVVGDGSSVNLLTWL
jgi:hypothetical protein